MKKHTYACWEVHLHREDTDILGTLVEDRDVGNIDGRGGRHWFGGGHGDHDVCRIYIYKQLLEDVGRRRRRLVRHSDGGDEQEEGGEVMGVGGEGREGKRGELYSRKKRKRWYDVTQIMVTVLGSHRIPRLLSQENGTFSS